MSVSNIAWDPEDDDRVAAVLRDHGVDAVDVAPPKYFPSIPDATAGEIGAVREAWEARGIRITGMQSLLFGTQGLDVFGSDQVQRALLDHLTAVCRIGGGLGARHLVFGSPRNRDRGDLDEDRAREVAAVFFRKVGERASDHGVVVTLEPNPTAYGANFMTTSASTAAVVREVDHHAIRMQLDTGACTMNDEDVAEVAKRHGELVGHVHLSAPHLAVVGDDPSSDLAAVAPAIRALLGDRVACIEMLKPTDEPAVDAVRRAVSFVVPRYQGSDA